MKSSSLRRALIYPLALVMFSLACSVIWVLYRAGVDAADELSTRLMAEQVASISHATGTHLSQASTMASAVLARPVHGQIHSRSTAGGLPRDRNLLEERLWSALGLFDNAHGDIYVGRENGEFIGLEQFVSGSVELTIRESGPAAPAVTYKVDREKGQRVLLGQDRFDARTRPWYQLAKATGHLAWSPIYADYGTQEPTITLAVPVFQKDSGLEGVVGADISLRQIASFLKTFGLQEKTIAYIMEPSGLLIGTNAGELSFTKQGNEQVRLHASGSAVELIRQTYQHVLDASNSLQACESCDLSRFFVVNDEIRVSMTRLQEPAGIPWIIVVAAPKDAFTGNITRKTYASIGIAMGLILLAVFIGFKVLQRLVTDVEKLVLAVDRFGRGSPAEPPRIFRSNEISRLAQSFETMQRNLQSDSLTGLLNKDSLIAQIEYRQQNLQLQSFRFGILFIDLDRFKLVNDTHGHESGDAVLKEVAHRLKRSLRNSDIVARLGGDEFAIYLHGVESDDTVTAIIEKIRMAVAVPIELPNGEFDHVGASIGAALYPDDGLDVKSLFKTADSRMYAFKKANRGAR